MSATPTRPPRRCPGCGRYTVTMDGFYCPRCAPLARWLAEPKKYPKQTRKPEKCHET